MSAVTAILASTLIDTYALGVRTSSATVATNKTYSPEGWKPNGVMSYADRSGGIPLLYPRFTFQMRPPTKESRVYKLSSKLHLPIAETIDPAVGIFGPRVAYELQGHLDVLLPERTTLAERTEFYSLLISMLVRAIAASDDGPSEGTASPIPPAILTLDSPF